jgi:hypothetical protein
MESRAVCLHCGAPIVDPTTQVIHGHETFCCANCAEAMEQRTGGSDRGAPRHASAIRCARCESPIVESSTMEESGGRVYCCHNCAEAARSGQEARTASD